MLKRCYNIAAFTPPSHVLLSRLICSLSLSFNICLHETKYFLKLLRLEILPAPRKKLSHLCLFRGGIEGAAGGLTGSSSPCITRKEGLGSQMVSGPEAVLAPTPSAAALAFFISHAHFLCGLICICQLRLRGGGSSPDRGRSVFGSSATTVEWSCKM